MFGSIDIFYPFNYAIDYLGSAQFTLAVSLHAPNQKLREMLIPTAFNYPLNILLEDDNPYLLIGPGRWGTSDPWLGIPVNWKQISNAKVIIELGIENLNPDPSYGSHFFQNLTSLHIGYFTIDKNEYKKSINWSWMRKQKVVKEKKFA